MLDKRLKDPDRGLTLQRKCGNISISAGQDSRDQRPDYLSENKLPLCPGRLKAKDNHRVLYLSHNQSFPL